LKPTARRLKVVNVTMIWAPSRCATPDKEKYQ
jgi:hypothetical protein